MVYPSRFPFLLGENQKFKKLVLGAMSNFPLRGRFDKNLEKSFARGEGQMGKCLNSIL